MSNVLLLATVALASPALFAALAEGSCVPSSRPQDRAIVAVLCLGAACVGGVPSVWLLLAAVCGRSLARQVADDQVVGLAVIGGLAAALGVASSQSSGLTPRTPEGVGALLGAAGGLFGLAAGIALPLLSRRRRTAGSLCGLVLLVAASRGRAGAGDLVLAAALLGSGGIATLARGRFGGGALLPALGILGFLHLGWIALTAPAPSPYAHPPELPQRAAAELDVVVGDAAFVSSLACLPDGRVLFGELASGRIWQIDPRLGEWAEPALFGVVPLPPVRGRRPSYELGLWGLAAAPDEPFVYAMAIHRWDEDAPDPRARTSRVVRLRTDEADPAVQTVVDGLPAGPIHAGGVLRFAPDGVLYASIGDGLRFGPQGTDAPLAVDRDPLAGTIVRWPRGQQRAEVVASGLRNVYGLAFAARGELYATENGADCCDALVRVSPGSRFGWPPSEDAAEERITPPLWTSGAQRLGPTGLAVLSPFYGEYAGDLVFGTWHTGALHRVRLNEAGGIAEHEILAAIPGAPALPGAPYAFAGAFSALDVCPDGRLWFSTLNAVGRVARIRPR